MSILSVQELKTQAQRVVDGRIFEALLLNNTGFPYSSTTAYSTFVQNEVSVLAGGYERLEFSFLPSDIVPSAFGASTVTKYITWVHNGNATPITFNTILIVEKIFAQPLNEYNIVAFHPLGVDYILRRGGERARFAFRMNLKNK